MRWATRAGTDARRKGLVDGPVAIALRRKLLGEWPLPLADVISIVSLDHEGVFNLS